MKKRSLLFLLVLSMTAAGGFALEVSGQIQLPKESSGILYIFLITKEDMKRPCTGTWKRTVPVNTDTSAIHYRFTNIPSGEYGLRLYLDTNKNGKLDRGIRGPKEPWALSTTKELRGIPSFDDIAFRLNENMSADFTLITAK